MRTCMILFVVSILTFWPTAFAVDLLSVEPILINFNFSLSKFSARNERIPVSKSYYKDCTSRITPMNMLDSMSIGKRILDKAV